VDAADARVAFTDSARRFADLIRSAPDAEQPVVGSDWCVREVAAHLVAGAESLGRYLTGDTTPAVDLSDLARTNPVAIATVHERELAALANRLETAVNRFLDLTRNRDVSDPMWWHGVESTVGAVYGIYIGEFLMHGDDVARTMRRPWPIDKGPATIVFEGIVRVVHLFLKPKRAQDDASFDVRLRTGPSFALRFSKGGLRVEGGRGRNVDCRISADPVALLLVLYKRRSQWRAIARGQLVAFGRKPWLAFGLKDRFGGF
jgi:uncharacterized protein (TIGR03083 family)